MFILFPQQQIYDISIDVNSLTDVFLISYDINKATASDICSIYLSIFWKCFLWRGWGDRWRSSPNFFILMTQLNAHTYGHIIKLDSHENVFGGLSKHVHIISIIIISYYRVKRLPSWPKNKSFRNWQLSRARVDRKNNYFIKIEIILSENFDLQRILKAML